MTFRGSLAWRENDAWRNTATNNFLTSEGETRPDLGGSRPRWVDLHGAIGGRVSGVTAMDHPGNFRYPQPARMHPDKPYFCFAPNILGDFAIEPGKPLAARYRYFVHDGTADAAAAARMWHDFAEPVTARLMASR